MRLIVLIVMLTMSLTMVAGDSLRVENSQKESLLQRLNHWFSDQDTVYVEPQHYNWSLMLQSITTYDYYRLSTTGRDGQSISFSPKTDIRLGPYFGWRWVFLGYTFDLRSFNIFNKMPRFELDASIYSARFGADIFYRRTTSQYRIRNFDMGRDVNTSAMSGLPFDGLQVSITGVNLYYIFNHKHFSYPAAFAQSSRQKVSCGTWMAGFGYLNNSIDFDYQELEALAHKHLGPEVQLDSGFNFNSVKYRNISASVGYAYNWVFARHWLFCSSASLALAYKKSYSEHEREKAQGFNFGNFNLDGVGRFGLVWNNDRFYAGASAIVRAYNYRKSQFATNNIFGDLNIYFGWNFGPRSEYKKRRQ